MELLGFQIKGSTLTPEQIELRKSQKQQDMKSLYALFDMFLKEYPEYGHLKGDVRNHRMQVEVEKEFRYYKKKYYESISKENKEILEKLGSTLTNMYQALRSTKVTDTTSAQECMTLVKNIRSREDQKATYNTGDPELKAQLDKATEAMKQFPGNRALLSADLFTAGGDVVKDKNLEGSQEKRELLDKKYNEAASMLDKAGVKYASAAQVENRKNYETARSALVKKASKTLTPKQCKLIGKLMSKEGLDGNGRLTVSEGLSKVNRILELYGYSLPMQTGDTFLSVDGSKLLPILGPDGSEEEKHGIAFSWHRFNELATDDVCELVAYVS